MQIQSQKSSLRKFLLLLACPVVACGAAFFICYGRNIAWAMRNSFQEQYAPLTVASLDPAAQDEQQSQCTFLNVTIDVPAVMASNAKIVKGTLQTRWLVFEDDVRKIRIPLTSGQSQRPFYGDIPASISKLTNTELLSHLYRTSSTDFSLGMNKAQLQEHDWAMSCRDLFGYGLHLDKMNFKTEGDFQALTLFVTTAAGTRRASGWLAFANWSLADHSDGGMVYFFDNAVGDSNWAVRSALSLRRPANPATKNNDEFEELIAHSTDEELLRLLEVSQSSGKAF